MSVALPEVKSVDDILYRMSMFWNVLTVCVCGCFSISFCIYIEVFQFGLMGLVANIHLYVLYGILLLFLSSSSSLFFLHFRLLPSVSVE